MSFLTTATPSPWAVGIPTPGLHLPTIKPPRLTGPECFSTLHARTANKAFDDDQIKPISRPSLLAAAYPAKAASKETIVPAPAPAAETTETIGHINREENYTTKELDRVHAPKRRALFVPDTSKTCPIAHTHTEIYNQRFTKRFQAETKEPVSSIKDNLSKQGNMTKDNYRVVDRTHSCCATAKSIARCSNRPASHTSTCTQTNTRTTLSSRRARNMHHMSGDQF